MGEENKRKEGEERCRSVGKNTREKRKEEKKEDGGRKKGKKKG